MSSKRSRFIVYEQDIIDPQTAGSIGDVFGIFYNWSRANALAVKLTHEHPNKFYGIRELLHGDTWLKVEVE